MNKDKIKDFIVVNDGSDLFIEFLVKFNEGCMYKQNARDYVLYGYKNGIRFLGSDYMEVPSHPIVSPAEAIEILNSAFRQLIEQEESPIDVDSLKNYPWYPTDEYGAVFKLETVKQIISDYKSLSETLSAELEESKELLRKISQAYDRYGNIPLMLKVDMNSFLLRQKINQFLSTHK